MSKSTVIHRDRTFEYDGETWRVYKLGPRGSGDEAYEVSRLSDGASVGEQFDTLSEVRRYVDECRFDGLPLIDEAAW